MQWNHLLHQEQFPKYKFDYYFLILCFIVGACVGVFSLNIRVLNADRPYLWQQTPA